MDSFIKNERQEKLVKRAKELAERFKENTARIDQDAQLPFANIDMLKSAGFLGLAVPEEYGGEEISLYELVLVLEQLAQGDAATALGFGWHLGVLMDIRDRRTWDEETFKSLCLQIVEQNAFLNRAQTEPETGDPTRGGVPATTASNPNGKWILNGKKTYTTFGDALDHIIVKATIEGTEDIADFLVKADQEGIALEKKWDTLGMRGTRSDDLILENVEATLVETYDKERKEGLPPAWLLHIPPVYVGIALAARKEAIEFAKSYQPNSLPHPISEVPHIQSKIGELELELITGRHTLYSIAKKWDEDKEKRIAMAGELFAAKHVAVNAAIKAVDLSMKIVGGRSLSKDFPFERYYRDVRAGLHNPPVDDLTLHVLAGMALK
ncbi:acyl-CoA dehydrogenase family protein [Pseudalkalibacillus caeni]|uniref:acyl-CoA dehydrogenase family protein n=1 Tax=Exobacillus caeni TaxID=2574798 RepID=UPI001FE47080|nr:acyl-CoA dehydrogenase family protein [Pseudalkalibacillus caeni]